MESPTLLLEIFNYLKLLTNIYASFFKDLFYLFLTYSYITFKYSEQNINVNICWSQYLYYWLRLNQKSLNRNKG